MDFETYNEDKKGRAEEAVFRYLLGVVANIVALVISEDVVWRIFFSGTLILCVVFAMRHNKMLGFYESRETTMRLLKEATEEFKKERENEN